MLSESGRRCMVISADFGADNIVVDNIDQVKEKVGIGIPTRDIHQTPCQPVADAVESLGARPQEQELLEKGICQDGYKLGRQLQLVQVLDKGFSIFNLLQRDGFLHLVSLQGPN